MSEVSGKFEYFFDILGGGFLAFEMKSVINGLLFLITHRVPLADLIERPTTANTDLIANGGAANPDAGCIGRVFLAEDVHLEISYWIGVWLARRALIDLSGDSKCNCFLVAKLEILVHN